MAGKLPSNCSATTFNSLGNQLCRQNMGYTKLNEDKLSNILSFEICNKNYKMFKALYPAIQLCAVLKCLGTEPDKVTQELCEQVEEMYCLDSADSPEYYNVVHRLYSDSAKKPAVIDYNDQILYPTLRGFNFPYYDVIFVDEAQDLNQAQIDLLLGFTRTNPRLEIIAVGDPYQAIYGFRGSSVDAVDKLKSTFTMTETSLLTCWRCSRAVIAEAQKVVPDIQPRPDAQEGEVTNQDETCSPLTTLNGDFVLCRTRAPLIKLALMYIKSNQTFQFRAGHEIEYLISLHRKLENCPSIGAYLDTSLTQAQEDVKKLKLARKLAKVNITRDSYDILRTVATQSDSVQDIPINLDRIFEHNSSYGPVLSTIHRSKGLEAPTVYLLRPDLLPHPMSTSQWQLDQERNLKYVAITRARNKFVHVHSQKGK